MHIGWKRLTVVLMLVVLASLLSRVAFVLWAQFSSDQAAKHVIAVGGRVECEPQPDYTVKVGNQTIYWDVGSPGRLYHILWWTYYSEPEDLCFVDLSRCQLTSADCKTISAIRNAPILNVRDASLPADGLAYLMAIPTLVIVDLRGVAIPNDTLQILKRNDRLRAVVITASLVAPEIIRKFALDMPSCEILSE